MAVTEPPSTSPTLLRLLAAPGSGEAWEVFIERYGPMIDACCRRAGLQAADAEDVRAEVCAQLVRAMRSFRYEPGGRFRGYLKRVADHAIRTHWRRLRCRPGWVGCGGEEGHGLPEPLAGLGEELDERIRTRVEAVAVAVERVKADVESATWASFALTVLDGLSGAEAAERLEKSVAAVYMSKSRVLARLRAELAGEAAG